jgi:LacI family transcriptional regulator
MVAIDPHAGRADLPTVESDSFGGARNATAFLIGLGHRRIAFVAGRPDLRSSSLRDAGYRRALGEAGIPFDPSLVAVGRYEHDTVREVALPLLRRPDRPTAVFAANDISAIAVIEVAAELGLDVPRDLSVVGFDDIRFARFVDPPLTTIAQPMRDIGEASVRLLLDILHGRITTPQSITLPHTLIIRSTTAPVGVAAEASV